MSGIWIKTIPEFNHDLDSLRGQHTEIVAGIGFVGSLSIPEDLNDFLHCF
ncbi:MAG TPA: hypothetical protein VGL82_23245 [Bryobacteraceae bacterium]